MNKKKILLLIKIPPPVTGATLMNMQIMNSNLLHKNFNIRIIGISYASNNSNLGLYSFKKLLVFISKIFSLIIELIFHRPNAIYFQISPIGLVFIRDLIFVTIIKIFKVKIIYHLHGKGIKQEVQSKYKKLLYKFAFRKAEIICVSALLTYDIEDIVDWKIHIVNNGVPDYYSKNYESVHFVNNSLCQILFLSNLSFSKGIIDFLDALSILDKKRIQFKATIVGAVGNFKESQLKHEIDYRGLLDKVSYLGPLYNDEKYKIISKSDIMVFPTKNDIWGNVNLEAMQMCKPVIATKEGAIPEIIDDGITGFLVDKNSPEQIAEKIEILVKNPELRIKMGAEGRKKYLQKYTLQIFEENINNVFLEVLKR